VIVRWALAGSACWIIAAIVGDKLIEVVLRPLPSEIIGALYGAIVGGAGGAGQILLMRRSDSEFARRWGIATAVGWAVGMFAFYQIGIGGPGILTDIFVRPGITGGWIASGVVTGVVFGLTTGISQWFVVREQYAHAARWIAIAVVIWTLAATLDGVLINGDTTIGFLPNPIFDQPALVGGLLTGAALPLFLGLVRVERPVAGRPLSDWLNGVARSPAV
jgi:hypothetical protein